MRNEKVRNEPNCQNGSRRPKRSVVVKCPTMKALLASIARHVMDFCYPGICAVCESACDGGQMCCDVCLGKLQALEQAAACQRCAAPLSQPGAPCAWCLSDGIYPYDRIIRLGLFKDPLKHLIHQMKYHRRWPLAESLAERLWAQDRVRTLLNETDCIVPVPLHRWKQIARGYNQSDVITKWLKRRSGKPIRRPLVRLRATETQTHLHSREKRVANVRNAFGLIDPRKIKDKRVLVVDDVMTTGAT